MMPESPRNRLRDYLDAVIEEWIGWTFPPVERAIEEAQWRPDEREAYCVRCGDSVGAGEATPEGCASCRKGGELAGGVADGVVRLGPYVGALRDWILRIKFDRWGEMAGYLGHELGRRVKEAQIVDVDRVVVIPMPMPWQRRVFRGVDHARIIASAAADALGAPMGSILTRSNRPPQVSLPASERRRTGARGMRIRRRLGGWSLDGWQVLLVDDVRTTGASLKAATRLIRRLKPQRIFGAVVAVTDSKARRVRPQAASSLNEASRLAGAVTDLGASDRPRVDQTVE